MAVAPANASVIYTFTATTDNGAPLPSFVLTEPSFITSTLNGVTTFTSSSNLLDASFLPGGVIPGFDVIDISNIPGTNLYAFPIGSLGMTGTFTATTTPFLSPSFNGTLIVTQTSAVPEPSVAVLLALPVAFLMLYHRKVAARRTEEA
jgi:hypothetical protein